MSFRRIVMIAACLMAVVIGYKAVKKRQLDKNVEVAVVEETPVEVKQEETTAVAVRDEVDPDDNVDLIDKFFSVGHDKLPIVETVTYKSRVPWLKGRPAWIADYASHYATSRHFIARSLNKGADYYTQKVSPGDRFNVLNSEKPVNFYLLIDINKLKMWFYYVDIDAAEKVLLKTYRVGLGTLKNEKSLTPTGRYLLGDKIAAYKPGMMGWFNNEKVELISVFGTRWLPFKEELANCSDSAKGYGIHGVPCMVDPKTDKFMEKAELVGQYDSDGCVRLSKDDVEEIYSIIVTRPTIVEIVDDAKEIRRDNKRIPEPIAYGE